MTNPLPGKFPLSRTHDQKPKTDIHFREPLWFRLRGGGPRNADLLFCRVSFAFQCLCSFLRRRQGRGSERISGEPGLNSGFRVASNTLGIHFTKVDGGGPTRCAEFMIGRLQDQMPAADFDIRRDQIRDEMVRFDRFAWSRMKRRQSRIASAAW